LTRLSANQLLLGRVVAISALVLGSEDGLASDLEVHAVRWIVDAGVVASASF